MSQTTFERHYKIPMPCKESVIALERNFPRTKTWLSQKQNGAKQGLQIGIYNIYERHDLTKVLWASPHLRHQPTKLVHCPPWCLPSSLEEYSCCGWLLGEIQRKFLAWLFTHRPRPHQLAPGDSATVLEGTSCIQCHIMKMFLQFKVQPHQRDFLRFLWWDACDTTRPPSHFRMNRHLFGAVSSMG